MNDLDDVLGAAAYDTYREAVGGVSVSGDQLPDWRTLSEKVRGGWIAAAREIADTVANWYY